MSKINLNDVDLDDPRFRIKPYQQMISSCSGAFITSLIVTPLDVVKVRMQAQQKAILSNRCFLYCNGLMDHLCSCPSNGSLTWLKANEKFNGTLDALIKISKKEGISSLWSGLSPTLTLAIPATVIYFVTYEQLRLHLRDVHRKKVKNENASQPYWIPMIAGGAARIWAAMIVSPLELIRTKMQSQKLSHSELTEILRDMIQQKGIRGLWLGLGSTLLRDVPFSAIYWMNYENIKQLCPASKQTFSFHLLAGATSGTIAACVTLPFDVVKTHKQIEIGEKEIYTDKPAKAKSTWKILQKIYRQSGIKGLFIGWTPRVIKVAPACAIMIATFEQGKQFFATYNANKVIKNIQLVEQETNV